MRNTPLINQESLALFDHLKIELPLLIPGNLHIYLSFIHSHSRPGSLFGHSDKAGNKIQGVGEAEPV